MHKTPFKVYHLFQLLQSFDAQKLPIDLFMSRYFRAHKQIGSKDKAFISETTYTLIRWKGLIDAATGSSTWAERLDAYWRIGVENLGKIHGLQPHQQVSFPKEIFELVKNAYGYDRAVHLCKISNAQAPTTIRVNALKLDRDTLIRQWQDAYSISPCRHSSQGIRFHKKINFFGLEEFRNGLFEVQDEASQLLACLVRPKPGDCVIDWCSGSGGKTLAFAANMNGKGQIYLHDIRPTILQEAKKRLKRAGIQNAQIIQPAETKKQKKLQKKADWVLVDVPCSGSGTWRRNPDMKWKFHVEMLHALVVQQREILKKALGFLKDNGKIVYTTCSIFPEENEQQIAYFEKYFGLKLCEPPFQSLPADGEMDGMFGAILVKTR